MATPSRRRKMPSKSSRLLSRDLLNLALILAFLHIDPESYLGIRMYQNSDIFVHNKILDDLSSLGSFSQQQFDQEISAYILNAETVPEFDYEAVTESQQNHAGAENQQHRMADEDSGVSDVDSGHQSETEDTLSLFQPSSGSSLASPAQLNDLEDANDWVFRSDVKLEAEDTAEIEAVTPTPLSLLNDAVQPPPLNYDVFLDVDESSNIFRDLDDIIGQASTSALDSSETKEENNDYSPDEEDVENQLMHIDDRLIRIDENIDGLDQQLLSVEEENFLFESMPDLTPSMTMSDAVEYQHDQEIEELIAAGLPSPLMPSPFLIDADEAKDVEPIENPVIKQEIKEEVVDEVQDWIDQQGPLSPADSLASSTLPVDLLSTEEEETSSHLLDHNYALSAFDECFGSSSIASSLSPKTSFASSDYADGASALSHVSKQRESRDERKARELNLPFAVADIIDLPIDAFNELLTRFTLTEDQLNLCRDIRRRGKNKVAAQNCRKRKMDLISQLEEEVSRARHQKQQLLAEREELYRLRNEWTHKLLNLETAVLRGLNRNVNDYTLDYSGAGVKVTTRTEAKAKA